MALNRLPDGRIPVVLSAHADELVYVDARAIADYLDRFRETTVAQVARQLRRTRRVYTYRAVLRAADRPELIDGLRALAAGREHPLVARSALRSSPPTGVRVSRSGWSLAGHGHRCLPGAPELSNCDR